MKSASAIWVLVSFVAIAVFGVFAMGHMAGELHQTCLAVAAQGAATCPDGNPLAAAAFHASVFTSFSNAVVDASPATLAALFAIWLAFAAAAFLSVRASERGALAALDPRAGRLLGARQASSPLLRALSAWRARHEHSPTA